MVNLNEIPETISSFMKISTEHFVAIVIIIVLTILMERITGHFMTKVINRESKILKIDKTKNYFLKYFLSTTIYIIGFGAIIYTIPTLRTLYISLFAGAGVIAIIIGFASKEVFANLLGGILIIITKPFKIDDIVSVDDKVEGVVEDITLSHTVIRNWENRRFIIPNSIINTKIIKNSTIIEKKTCRFFEVGISYESDLNKAIRIIKDEASKHPLTVDNRTAKEKDEKVDMIAVRVLELGDFFVKIRAYIWAKTPAEAFVIGTDLNISVKKRFEKEGIEIPYPHRTIVYKKDLMQNRK